MVSGFWRRLIAFTIDTIVLGVIGFVIGLPFGTLFAQMGSWAYVVGFAIAGVYFVLFDSRIGQGQTLGKQLLSIQVVAKNGRLLSPWAALARYSIFALPDFLMGVDLPSGTPSLVQVLMGVMTLGINAVLAYLIVFNRNTRQSLHDIATGTFVTPVRVRRNLESLAVWRTHYVVCAALLAGSLLLSLSLTTQPKRQSLAQLDQVQAELCKGKEFMSVEIQKGNSSRNSSAVYITANVRLRENTVGSKMLASTVAEEILASGGDTVDEINVILTFGYDIGIASSWHTKRYSHTPTEWMNEPGVQESLESRRPSK